MTSSAPQPAPCPPSPFTQGRHPHPWLLAAGIGELLLTQLAAVGYALLGIAVGTCSDSDGTGSCDDTLNSYHLAFWVLILNAAVGVLAVVLSRSRRGPVLHRVLAAAVVVSVGLGVLVGAALW